LVFQTGDRDFDLFRVPQLFDRFDADGEGSLFQRFHRAFVESDARSQGVTVRSLESLP